MHDVLDLVKGERYCVSCGENFIQAKGKNKTLVQNRKKLLCNIYTERESIVYHGIKHREVC